MFDNLNCMSNMIICLDSTAMTECYNGSKFNNNQFFCVDSRDGLFFITITDILLVQNNTIVTAMCGADGKSCDDGPSKLFLYSFQLIKSGAVNIATLHYNNSMIKVLIHILQWLAYFCNKTALLYTF